MAENLSEPKVYDTIIAGAGLAGLLTALRLLVTNPGQSILVVEAGGCSRWEAGWYQP